MKESASSTFSVAASPSFDVPSNSKNFSLVSPKGWISVTKKSLATTKEE